MNVAESVRNFIAHEELLATGERCLVALSGGADSVALLIVLRQLGFPVEAAHCNFHLRGDESDRDETFVREFCQRLDVPLHVAHFDTKTYASLHQVSIEMAARVLRYHYFDQLLNDLDIRNVCVAHHKDDAVETLLMNLLRGTGVHGLTGIRPRNGHVVRPMLCVNRAQIISFLASSAQDYVTDSTNQEDNVLRNRVRHQLVPLLTELNPSACDNLLRTARWMRETEHIYNVAVEKALAGVTDALPIGMLLEQPSPQCVLFEWLQPCGFSSTVAAEVLAALEKGDGTGKLWQSDSHELLIDRDTLLLQPHKEELPMMRIPETGTFVYANQVRFRLAIKEGAVVERDSAKACLDRRQVHFPLSIRPVRQGDRFHPLGMKGSRLVSDFLTDRKMSLFEKRRQLVVTDAANQILWLVGLRLDHRFRVRGDTQQTLHVTMELL